MNTLCIFVLRCERCPYCGEDHGDLEFYGTTEKHIAKSFCPKTMQTIVAEREDDG